MIISIEIWKEIYSQKYLTGLLAIKSVCKNCKYFYSSENIEKQREYNGKKGSIHNNDYKEFILCI